MSELVSTRIRNTAGKLGLPHLAETINEYTRRADEGKLGYLDFLDLVLSEELAVRDDRRFRQGLRLSRLPHHKTLDEYEVMLSMPGSLTIRPSETQKYRPPRASSVLAQSFIRRSTSATVNTVAVQREPSIRVTKTSTLQTSSRSSPSLGRNDAWKSAMRTRYQGSSHPRSIGSDDVLWLIARVSRVGASISTEILCRAAAACGQSWGR